ncbi:MAG: Gfo/Idh/MocA family oxidoreductase [Gemmatimonadota bacterium]
MSVDRRTFVQVTGAAAAALRLPRRAFGVGRPDADPIRIGVIGCGGRGTGAVRDALMASENVSLVAMGDLFPDHLASAREQFAKIATTDAGFAAKYRVTPEHSFTGLDAFRQVLASDIDLVILATPPAFRADHLAAAVAAGKHVFMEKPVAVDVVGALSVIASGEAARAKGLAVVCGTQRRHDPRYIETISRIHDGQIGDLIAGSVYWNQGGLWNFPRKPEWSDAEWQLRNWLYFTWLSGDHIVEQHVHNLDVANWVMGAVPVRAMGVGGRQARTSPDYGHIFDHFAIEYEYPGGVRINSMCRQQDGTASNVGERFVGSKGTSNGYDRIEGKKAWKWSTAGNILPYVEEHRDLVASIRSGKPLNEARRIAESTLTAIMGREAAYTGQVITWEKLLQTPQSIRPPLASLGTLATPPVPVPGQTVLMRGFNSGW